MKHWRSQLEIIKPHRIYKFSLFVEDRALTYAEVIELWQRDRDFDSFLILYW